MSLYEFWNLAMLRALKENGERPYSNGRLLEQELLWQHWRFRDFTKEINAPRD